MGAPKDLRVEAAWETATRLVDLLALVPVLVSQDGEGGDTLRRGLELFREQRVTKASIVLRRADTNMLVIDKDEEASASQG